MGSVRFGHENRALHLVVEWGPQPGIDAGIANSAYAAPTDELY